MVWFKERLRDLALWPLNLVRDFPRRAGRLASTLRQGARGAVLLGPDFFAAVRAGSVREWGWQESGRFANWLHRFITQLFDLAGGPEVCQFFMHLITNTTPLTDGEIATISAILGPDAMRYRGVRVAAGGLFDLIFKLNGNLAFTTWYTINVPRNGRHTRSNRAIIVHELTHVYQYERVGTRYLGEAIYVLVKTKRNCYNYGASAGLRLAYVNGRRYCDFNREQQAQITQDYYTLGQREQDVSAYEPFILQVKAGEI